MLFFILSMFGKCIGPRTFQHPTTPTQHKREIVSYFLSSSEDPTDVIILYFSSLFKQIKSLNLCYKTKGKLLAYIMYMYVYDVRNLLKITINSKILSSPFNSKHAITIYITNLSFIFSHTFLLIIKWFSEYFLQFSISGFIKCNFFFHSINYEL